MLNFNPALMGKEKNIQFEEPDKITVGSNSNEHSWELSGKVLTITRQNGELQNAFRYDERSDRFICTNDPNAAGIRDQVIYRP